MSTQQTFFDLMKPVRRGRARTTDPETSQESAAKVNAGHLERQVLGYLQFAGPRTTKELADEMSLSRITISPRLAPMERKGLVERTKETRDGCIVWRAVKADRSAA